jgi:hypothetical protein
MTRNIKFNVKNEEYVQKLKETRKILGNFGKKEEKLR